MVVTPPPSRRSREGHGAFSLLHFGTPGCRRTWCGLPQNMVRPHRKRALDGAETELPHRYLLRRSNGLGLERVALRAAGLTTRLTATTLSRVEAAVASCSPAGG